MATVFGISGLKSKLDDWRANRRGPEPIARARLDTDIKSFNVIGRADEEYDLSLLLENLVIPKLIADRDKRDSYMETSGLWQPCPSTRSAAITSTDVEAFTILSVESDAHSLLDFVDHILESGSSVETVYIELLAPAARRLGEYWEDDSQDFVAVTMALWRIQEVLRELTLRIPPNAHSAYGQRTALFSPMPGAQHSFGTLMVAECFQRAGWDTDVLIEPTQSELLGKIAENHYDLFGLTVSCDCSTASLCNLVTTIKTVSSNAGIRILIGGGVINAQPGLVEKCGADATAIDAVSAVTLANRLVPVHVECFEYLS